MTNQPRSDARPRAWIALAALVLVPSLWWLARARAERRARDARIARAIVEARRAAAPGPTPVALSVSDHAMSALTGSGAAPRSSVEWR